MAGHVSDFVGGESIERESFVDDLRRTHRLVEIERNLEMSEELTASGDRPQDAAGELVLDVAVANSQFTSPSQGVDRALAAECGQ
jgi:hypothetical protein